jgi:hypothetical protein
MFAFKGEVKGITWTLESYTLILGICRTWISSFRTPRVTSSKNTCKRRAGIRLIGPAEKISKRGCG